MNINEVEDEITKINEYDEDGDYEKAHILEDELLVDFIRFVAALDNEYTLENTIATILLRHLERNEYPRWCA